MAQPALVIDYRAPGELKPYAGNARAHPKSQIEQLKASISANGFVNPVLIDEAGLLIAGHGRWQAAKALGLSSIPTITLPGLSERAKAKIRLADNQIAANAAWDLDLLKDELKLVSAESAIDFMQIGFDPGRVDAILNAIPLLVEQDASPPVPATAVSRAGDVWCFGKEGQHRLGCGDCRDPQLLDCVMAGAVADAAFLDPPYNLKIDGHAVGKGKHREFAEASGELTPEAFVAFLKGTLGALASVTKDGGVHFVCMDHHHVDELIEASAEVYSKRLAICVWDKQVAGMGSLYRNRHELVFVQKVGEAPHFNAVQLGKHGRSRSTVWACAGANSPKGSRRHDLEIHPTCKPQQLVMDAIQDVTRRGEVVLDGFMGSGTTALSCERTGRISRGVELDPLYVDLALQRFSDLFGGVPHLAATEQTFTEARAERAASHKGE